MSLYSQFETDPEIEKNGIELVYNMGSGKAIILRIGRAGGGNTRYQKIMSAKTKPYSRQLATETIEPATLDKIMREVYSEAVVLGWWTASEFGTDKESRAPFVDDKEGKPMEFTKINVVKLFTDLPDFFADVQSQAQKVALFRKQVLEEQAGN